MRIRGLATAFLLLTLSSTPPLAAAPFGDTLLLEIYVNDHSRHVVAPVTEYNGLLFMKSTDLADCNIKINAPEIPRNGLVAVNRLSGIKTELRDDEQKLMITATDDRLMSQVFDLRGQQSDVMNSSTGFMGSYDLVGTVDDFDHANQSTNGGATLGGTLFTPKGTLTGTGFTQTQTGLGHFTRLDTTAEMDEPGIMRRWLAGDAISGGLNWSRSVRFAGLQVGTDFSLRPDLATMPLPAFFGQTAVPATVDVFVNAARVFETNVDSGPFQINNLPIITGGGQVNVVTRDVLGQQTTASLPFYASSQLLQKGLQAYNIDAGMVRKDYGQASFHYGTPETTATYSRGVTNSLTLETHGEAAERLQLLGGGAIFSLGNYGVVHSAVSGSTYNTDNGRQNGTQFSLSAETQSQPVNLFASASKTAGTYADVATLGSTPPPTFQTQLGGNIGLANYGSLATSWIEVKNNNQNLTQLLSGSYTLSFGGRFNLGVTSFYDITNRSSISEAVLTISLNGGWIGHSSVRADDHAYQGELGVIKPANPDGGVGYQLLGTKGETDTKQGEVTWINSRSTLDGTLVSRNGTQAGRFTASGGVAAMDGSLYTTQYPNGAIALVRTGQPNSRVYRENREVATTNDDGETLLTNFVPYTANHIAIDPRDYDIGTTVKTTEQVVVPPRQSGVIVDLSPQRNRSAVLVLRKSDGDYVPLGARVTLDGSTTPLVVGRHGETFIDDAHKTATGRAEYDGGNCRFDITVPDPSKVNPIPHIDPVPCIAEQNL